MFLGRVAAGTRNDGWTNKRSCFVNDGKCPKVLAAEYVVAFGRRRVIRRMGKVSMTVTAAAFAVARKASLIVLVLEVVNGALIVVLFDWRPGSKCTV